MDTIISQSRGDASLDDLYARYSCRLLAAAAERLAAISPAAAELDEDVAQDVWEAVAAGHYPSGYRGLDGLLRLLDSAVRKVRVTRAREWAAGLARHTRRTAGPVDRDDLAATRPTAAVPPQPARPTRVSGIAARRVLPLAG